MEHGCVLKFYQPRSSEPRVERRLCTGQTGTCVDLSDQGLGVVSGNTINTFVRTHVCSLIFQVISFKLDCVEAGGTDTGFLQQSCGPVRVHPRR